MKSLNAFLLSIFLCFFTQFLSAQDISKAPESIKNIAKINVEKWSNSLILTTNQGKKLFDKVVLHEMKKMEIYKSNHDMDYKNKAISDLKNEHNKSVEAILSAEQIKKFKAKILDIKSGS